MNNFSTITTYDHLYKVYALSDSICSKHPDDMLHVLCINGDHRLADHPQCRFYGISDIVSTPSFEIIYSKYKRQSDKLRWSLKPVFLYFLLQNQIDKVIYIDNDVYFFGECTFLLDQLDQHSFLITPHHYPRDPHKEQNWLEANFKVGLYNAGFVGVNSSAKNNLLWWADCCAYRCEKNPLRGTFDDQKYLDLIPIIAEDTLVLKHKGCNVAEWNRAVIKRTIREDGSVWLDDIYPLIFVHFNHTTIKVISEGKEPAMVHLLKDYIANLQAYDPSIKVEKMVKPEKQIDKIKYYIWKRATDLNL